MLSSRTVTTSFPYPKPMPTEKEDDPASEELDGTNEERTVEGGNGICTRKRGTGIGMEGEKVYW
jgi:hypothetical protein